MIARVSLWCLAVSAAAVGLPATVAPRSFYDGWPFGRGWVELLPPYNQHLIGDVGGCNVTHLGGFAAGDAIAQTAGLALVLILPSIAVAALPRRPAPRAAPPR
jgi:hypothetical protein